MTEDRSYPELFSIISSRWRSVDIETQWHSLVWFLQKKLRQAPSKVYLTMKKEAILATRLLSQEDGCWLVTSSLLEASELGDQVLGADHDKAKALSVFEELLDDVLDGYRRGEIMPRNGPGKPKKNKVRLFADVSPSSRDAILALAKKLGVSQGEVLNYLVAFYEAAKPFRIIRQSSLN